MDTGAVPSSDRTKVVFIAGYARSGSTILDRELGAADGWVSAGELRFIWDRGFAQDQYCACGARFRACAFWREVASEAYGGMDRVDVARVLAWQRRFDQWWRIPTLGRAAAGRASGELAAYLEHIAALYPAIARVAGARVVVDSSKDASYGYVVAASPGVDLAVVHLVRDPRAVAYSLCERRRFDPGSGRTLGGHSTTRAVLGWTGTNVFAEPLGRRGGRMRVRYERFADDPEGVLGDIHRLAGESDAPARTDDASVLTHQVAGNPIRFDPRPVAIRRDDAWRREMTIGRRVAVTAATWPLLLAYERR